ncbi:hypothetical protein KDA00_00010 [Candidatus Saccharibacteria bacterium]|nr:hypothetical protein [Candidatus Saccharibacteria bacterium]
MINEKFVLVGAALNLMGSSTYAWNTFKGRTKPNRVTWFLWALAPLIAFAAQINEGVTWASIMTFMVGFGPLVIFTVSFIDRKAYWKISNLDIICGITSLLALLFWYLTGTGVIAIMFSIIADLLAGIPTIVKSWKEPETEHHAVFRNGALSATITLLVIDDWTFASYSFALYILLICLLLYVLIRFKLGKKFSKPAKNVGKSSS